MFVVRTLSQRLEALKLDLPHDKREEMDNCIAIAENLDRLAATPNAHARTGAPEPSFGNVTEEDLNRGQRDVLRVFRAWPEPMDELTLMQRYTRTFQTDDVRYIGPKVSTLRARRSDLEKRGMVTKVDEKGRSETGRKAGRYQIAPGYRGSEDGQ